jgi:Fuc2NAc and GlcNAc transferase
VTSTAFYILMTTIFSALLCGFYLRVAKRWNILDIPNERSSHERPTPSGGGLPLMLAFFFGVAFSFGIGIFWSPLYGAVLSGAIFLTVLGVADDNWTLSVRLRFFAYGLCCVLVAATVLRGASPDASLLLIFCTAFAMLWALNLYNFMDGVDGVAATQCFLACSAAALLVWSSGGAFDYALFCLLLGFSHLGFLLWNWPAARLFMGDAGSISAGFTLASLAVLGSAQGYLSIACWLVLLGAFITDASWTLARRIITRQKFTQAHRSHAYQRLSRRWGSHQSVVVLLIFINAIWLFPLAWAIVLWPQYTISLVILAYLPLLVGMAKLPDIT